MKTPMTFRRTNKLAALAALLTATTTSSTAFAHEEESMPFTMAVIIDGAQGAEVQAGRYEKAINRITRSGRRVPKDFAAQVNLCVAYAKTKDLQKASNACDAAIAEVKTQDKRMSRIKNDRNPELLAYRSDLALALSNRGVLLAAIGDTERAKRSFHSAIELGTRNSWIFETNLRRLAQDTSS